MLCASVVREHGLRGVGEGILRVYEGEREREGETPVLEKKWGQATPLTSGAENDADQPAHILYIYI